MRYTAVIIKEGNWYAGFIKELPGVNSQGKTIDELVDNLKEAAQLIIESNLKHKFDEIGMKTYEERVLVI